MRIKIGTRNSELSLIQTRMAIKAIKSIMPNVHCDIIPVVTTGDRLYNKPLYEIGGKALFLKELEEQLILKKIDLAVHSMKDIPGIIQENLAISAVLERDDPRDVLLSKNANNLYDLPPYSIFGSCSPRRISTIKHIRQDLNFVALRGNIHTRINKFLSGEVDSTILAYAALKRCDLYNEEYCHLLDINDFLPAAGQGTIAIEIRKDDKLMWDLSNKINHIPTWCLAMAERNFISKIDANCRTPLGVYAVYDDMLNQKIKVRYMKSSIDGATVMRHVEIGNISEIEDMTKRAVDIMSSITL